MSNPSLLDGKKIAAAQLDSIKQQISHQNPPHLAVILVGNNPASEIYVRRKQATAKAIGIQSSRIELDESTTTVSLLKTIQELNQNPSIHGILVQLPLPSSINTHTILESIASQKDIDGFHPYHLGQLAQGRPQMMPCTTLGILNLLEAYDLPLKGRCVTVIGTSSIVGMPTALALTHRKATVSLCHRATPSLSSYTLASDIIISATGHPKLITKDHIKPNAVVVDVGIHRFADGTLCGDVDYQEVAPLCSWITPVPGGIGPMTIAALMQNTLTAFQQQQASSS